MAGKFDEYRDLAFEKKLNDLYRDRIPDAIFDTHLHNDFRNVPPFPKADDDVENDPFFPDWEQRLTELMGKRVRHTGMILPRAVSLHRPSTEALDSENVWQLRLAAHNGYHAAILIDPHNQDYDRLNAFLDAHPETAMFKPYFGMTDEPDHFEADLLTWAPEWMWQTAHERKLPVMVHLSHYYNMLDDPANVEQISYVSRKYPDCTIVLAHCALGHNPYRLKMGLEQIKGLKNVYFDCSGVAEALSICYVIQYFGHDHLLYGSDGYGYGVGGNRCVAFGPSFTQIHYHGLKPENYRKDRWGTRIAFLNSMFEGLEALFGAVDVLGLTDAQVEDIFLNNAMRLYGYKK